MVHIQHIEHYLTTSERTTTPFKEFVEGVRARANAAKDPDGFLASGQLDDVFSKTDEGEGAKKEFLSLMGSASAYLNISAKIINHRRAH